MAVAIAIAIAIYTVDYDDHLSLGLRVEPANKPPIEKSEKTAKRTRPATEHRHGAAGHGGWRKVSPP